MGQCMKCGIRGHGISNYCGPCYRSENPKYWKALHAKANRKKYPKKIVPDDVTARAILVLQSQGVSVESPNPKKVVKAICKFKNVEYNGVTKSQARAILQEFANKGELTMPQRRTDRRPFKARFKKIVGNDFTLSPEWRTLRYAALKKYGKKCMCCGRGPEHGVIMHVDHIKPRSRFPELALELTNLQILCEDCNLGKGAWDETDHRPQLKVIEGGKK